MISHCTAFQQLATQADVLLFAPNDYAYKCKKYNFEMILLRQILKF